MILKQALYIYISLLMGSCNSNAQHMETLEGNVTIIFRKDTVGHERFWLTKKDFGGLYFLEDVTSTVVDLNLLCGESGLKIPKKTTSFYDLPQYQSQGIKHDDFYSHYGGDVYLLDEETIIIAFQMKVRGFKLEKQPCKNFSIQSSYSCPVKREQTEYPIFLVVDVIESKSLNAELITKKGLKPYKKESFPVGICD